MIVVSCCYRNGRLEDKSEELLVIVEAEDSGRQYKLAWDGTIIKASRMTTDRRRDRSAVETKKNDSESNQVVELSEVVTAQSRRGRSEVKGQETTLSSAIIVRKEERR